MERTYCATASLDARTATQGVVVVRRYWLASSRGSVASASCSSFAHESRSVTVRLKTGAPGFESTAIGDEITQALELKPLLGLAPRRNAGSSAARLTIFSDSGFSSFATLSPGNGTENSRS